MAYRDASQVILRARDRLSDSDGSIFTDSEMLRHLDAVAVEFSGYRPFMQTDTINTVANLEFYDLPDDCMWVGRSWVENAWSDLNYILGYYGSTLSGSEGFGRYNLANIDELYSYDLSRRREQLRARFAEYGQPMCALWNEQLQLFPTPALAGEIIHIEYASAHEKDIAGNYPTVSYKDIQHLETLLVARCLEILATDAAKAVTYTQGQTKVDVGSRASDFRKRAQDERQKVVAALDQPMVGIG